MGKQNIVVPDIGGASSVDVIEILVKPGDRVELETSLVTLETDKATMEIPCPKAGTVFSITLKVGDKVSEGDMILVLDTAESETAVESSVESSEETKSAEPEMSAPQKTQTVESTAPAKPAPVLIDISPSKGAEVSAGPAVRRFARSLGVNLAVVQGQGRKSRISKADVEDYVKKQLASPSASASGFALPLPKKIDFTKFGAIETKPLSKIKRLTGINVHQAWISIPQVTQFDHADITDLEAFRKAESKRAEAEGYKLTLVAFVAKLLSQALQKFPQFNSSLDETGEMLIYKKYCNIGIAAETPNGLVVPVIKDVHLKSVADIARDLGYLSSKAREKGLSPAEMSGGCFTISSLGGIGGTAFTPIVNPPEVAILGLSRSAIQPVFQNGQFIPRLLLPLSLTYDHRVIDGAEAARFTRYLSEGLSDIRRLLL
ncbi:MAG: dihydrolipoyllysine-residue acetyltransferase [Legionellaceae bacterium]|nr:dihydrolipoyllysine-residue acetyltransferase [Legionellaceae bacterium]MBP9775713.1 dihydrolipoyllysine-residue acetyltransferase [Legionellaceae bacterium]